MKTIISGISSVGTGYVSMSNSITTKAKNDMKVKIYLLSDIREATNVRISLERTSLMSSGTSQISAPSFLAMEMASLALAYLSSSVLPGVTRS